MGLALPAPFFAHVKSAISPVFPQGGVYLLPLSHKGLRTFMINHAQKFPTVFHTGLEPLPQMFHYGDQIMTFQITDLVSLA